MMNAKSQVDLSQRKFFMVEDGVYE